MKAAMKLAAIPALTLAGVMVAAVPAMASTPQHHQVSTETFTSHGLQSGDGATSGSTSTVSSIRAAPST